MDQTMTNNTDTQGDVYLGHVDFNVRNQVLKTLANRAGIRLPNTRVPEGESLLDIGEEAQRALQSKIRDLPDALSAVYAMAQRVKGEQHVDTEVKLANVRMSPKNGGLYGVGHSEDSALAYTDTGFGHITQFMKPERIRFGFKDNMLALPVALRSQVFNYWATTRAREDQLVLRTALADDRRLVRAVTSKKHSLESGDDLAVLNHMYNVDPASFKGAKARLTRGWDRSEFEIIWPAMDRQLQVGDIALVFLRIKNSETKAGCLSVEAGLLRVLCYNFTTAESQDINAEEIDLRHVGDLSKRLSLAFAKALVRVDPFVKAFGDAYKTALPGTRAEVLERVGKVYAKQLPSGVLDLTAQLWDADGERSAGDTIAGLVNAMTRASQSYGMTEAGQVEKVAGKLIMQGV